MWDPEVMVRLGFLSRIAWRLQLLTMFFFIDREP